MSDDVTPAEVYRRLKDHEQRTDETHRNLDNRITQVAGDSVSGKVWEIREANRDEQLRIVTERVKHLEEELDRRDRAEEAAALERVRERARDRRLVIAAIVAPILMMLLNNYFGLKGG